MTTVGRPAGRTIASALLLAAALCAGCGSDGEGGGADEAFTALRDDYFLYSLERFPVTSTYLGGDGYSERLSDANGRLRDYGPAALAAETAYFAGALGDLHAIDPARLNDTNRIDYDVLEAQLTFLVHQLRDRRAPERAVESYVVEPASGITYQLQQMHSFGNGLYGTEEEWDLVVSRLAAVPAYLQAARVQLAAGRATGNLPDRRMVQLDGIAGSQNNITCFTETLPATARSFLGDQPYAASVQASLEAAGDLAAAAYEDFIDFLEATYDPDDPVDRYAIGEAEYEFRIHNYFRVTQSAAELYDYGAEQVALFEGEMFEVAEQISVQRGLGLPFGTDDEKRSSTREVITLLDADHPGSDDELFAWYEEIGDDAVAYGREEMLFDVPADYQLQVVETPPALQSSILAAYNPAPPFKKDAGVGQFYVTPTNNDPAQLMESSRGFMTDIAVHEGFPGHDWHYKLITENAAQIPNIRFLTPGAVQDTSSMWSDSMAAEGWAHFAEQLMSEPAPDKPYGFYTIDTYLYFLRFALFRAVRVRVDVGLHTGRMGYDEAIDYFTEHFSFYPNACEVESDPVAEAECETARKEIFRYSKWPTQAITYNLGKSEILSLRSAYQEKLGSAYSAPEFYERLLTMGTIAPGFYREQFLDDAG